MIHKFIKCYFLFTSVFLLAACGRGNCRLSPYSDIPNDPLHFEACSASLLIEGNYQGNNVYIQNPVVDSSFCTCEVVVNGVSYPGDIKASAYEINLSDYTIGDSIKIKITHDPNCKPKVLNPIVH